MEANSLVVVPPGTRVAIHDIDLVDKPGETATGEPDFRQVHDMTDKKEQVVDQQHDTWGSVGY